MASPSLSRFPSALLGSPPKPTTCAQILVSGSALEKDPDDDSIHACASDPDVLKESTRGTLDPVQKATVGE